MKWVPTIKINKDIGNWEHSSGEKKQEGNSVIFKEEDKDLIREDSSQKIFLLKAHFYLKCDCPKPVKFKIKIIPPIGGPSERPRDD